MDRDFIPNRIALTLVTAFVLCCAIGEAQIAATLVGRITDESGAVLPGTTIRIVNTGKNETHTVPVGGNGEYVVPQLAPGGYKITAERSGFRRAVVSNVQLQTGQEARVDIAMHVGDLAQQVDVTSSTPLLATENAAVGNVVDQTKVAQLPLNGRNYLSLALLQPDVLPPAQGSTIGFRGGINIAGSSEISTQYLLDGIDNNDEATNQPLHTPVLDAVQEFRVLTGTYSAEFGRQSGGQVIVTTKSGENQFHGTVWDYYRNSYMDAKNYFASRKLSFIRNQYGLTLGGPIKKDKTFFFVAWESQNRGNGVSSVSSVPPLSFRSGNFSSLNTTLKNPFAAYAPFPGNRIPASLFSPQGLGLLNLYPLPNTNSSQNNISSTTSGQYNSDQFSTRVDQHIGNNDEFYGVYEFLDSGQFYPLSNPLCSARAVPGWGCFEYSRTQQATTGWTHIFSPTLVNEARFGYVRFGFQRLQQDFNSDVVNRLGIGGLTDVGVVPNNNGAPQITLTGYTTIGGATNLPQARHDDNYNYIDNLTLTSGSHTFKFGFDYLKILYNSFFVSSGRGAFSFQGSFTGNSVADLLLGIPYQASRNPGPPTHNNISDNVGTYIQDDWKVSPKLTINLGLRYEVDFPLRERVNKLSSFDPVTNTLLDAQGFVYTANPSNGALSSGVWDPNIGHKLYRTDWNNLGPRVGLAYRPGGGSKTVIRSGFGTFYNHQIAGNGMTSLMRNAPFRNGQTAGPFTAGSGVIPSLANAFLNNSLITPPGVAASFLTAYTNQWTFGLQQEVGSNMVLEVNYQGSESHKLPLPWNINQAFPGSGSVNSRRPYVGWGNITGGFIDSIGNANFNSLNVRLERRFSHGLSFTASYSWAKSIDNGSGISTSSTNSNSTAQDARDLAAERALSDFNVPQRLVFSYVWDLPFSMHFSRYINAVISGWQLTGILTAQKGQPFTPYLGTDQSSTAGGADRPNLIGNWNVSNQSVSQWFNACTLLATGALQNCSPGESPAWQQAAAGHFGNAGRNILQGPGLFNFDVGLYRQFRVTEKLGMQLRGEFYNATNHPNFYQPNATVLSTSYGSITQANDEPSSGAQREIQVALKVVF